MISRNDLPEPTADDDTGLVIGILNRLAKSIKLSILSFGLFILGVIIPTLFYNLANELYADTDSRLPIVYFIFAAIAVLACSVWMAIKTLPEKWAKATLIANAALVILAILNSIAYLLLQPASPQM